MTEHTPALIVLVPLVSALLLPILALVSKVLARGWTLVALLGTHAGSVSTLIYVLANGRWHYYLGGWAPPWGIEYVLDPLGAGMATLVSFLALLVAFYSGPYLKDAAPLKTGSFYALFLLVTAGLLGMVVTGDVFNLFVFLEISALATYGLVAMGGHRATVAAFRYLIVGTIGATFYLLGIGYLYAVTGTLNMADLAERIMPLLNSQAVVVAVALILAGFGIKMALFPLHGWLPDTYAYAPAPVTTFISAVMGKVAIYVLYRVFYFILGGTGPVLPALTVLGWAGAVGILAGSLMAIAQRDFWRMLAYSSIAQMGYIAVGLSLGNMMGITGALLHILNHAVVKGGLFMVAGGVFWRTGIRDIPSFIQMSRRMPMSMAVFVAAALSMIGIPPTVGFFSKWYLVLASIEASAWPFVIVIVVSSLLNAVYFFRIIENSYLRFRTAEEDEVAVGGTELPATMLVPMVVLGVAVFMLGVLSGEVVTNIISFALPWGTQ